MTSITLPHTNKADRTYNVVREMRCDPEIMRAIEQGMKARLEGRVKPWSEVKRELGI